MNNNMNNNMLNNNNMNMNNNNMNMMSNNINDNMLNNNMITTNIYQQNINNNDNNRRKPPKEIINRNIKDFKVENEFPNEDKNNLINIIFKVSSGLEVSILVPNFISIKELIKIFARKVGIPEDALGKEINFIYSASLININLLI